MGVMIYSSKNRGKLPSDFGEIAESLGGPKASLFVRPGSPTVVPDDLAHGTAKQIGDWANDHGDYEYFGANHSMKDFKNAATTPLFAEREAVADHDGINIGFADGHVEFVRTAKAREMIDAARQAQNAPENGL